MKYKVEVCYGDHNEWCVDCPHYSDALSYALERSYDEGVSETRVWFDNDIIDTCVDGAIVEDPWDEPEPIDEWDELGYDAYLGCISEDL